MPGNEVDDHLVNHLIRSIFHGPLHWLKFHGISDNSDNGTARTADFFRTRKADLGRFALDRPMGRLSRHPCLSRHIGPKAEAAAGMTPPCAPKVDKNHFFTPAFRSSCCISGFPVAVW